MSKGNTLIPINGKARPSLSQESFREVKKNFDMHREFITMMAQLTRAKLDALEKEGFSHEEALELSKVLF